MCSKTGVALCAIVIAWGALTFRYGSVWQNELTLWTWAAAQAPRKPRPQVNLALALMEQRRWAEAWELLNRVDSQLASDTAMPDLDRREALDAIRSNRLVIARVAPR